MPRDGFKSLTIDEECYDTINRSFNQRRETLRMCNITTISKYMKFLADSTQITTVDDLKELLCIQIQSQFILNDLLLGVDRETCQKNHFNQKQHMFEFLQKFQNES